MKALDNKYGRTARYLYKRRQVAWSGWTGTTWSEEDSEELDRYSAWYLQDVALALDLDYLV